MFQKRSKNGHMKRMFQIWCPYEKVVIWPIKNAKTPTFDPLWTHKNGSKMGQKWPKIGHFGPFLGPCSVSHYWPLILWKTPTFDPLWTHENRQKMGQKMTKNDFERLNLSISDTCEFMGFE